jgi:hypothetical protein
MGEKLKILVTVKTYPQPSRTYGEIVCTAGVREEGTFVRLYPIEYRYLSYTSWYKKYQWIEVTAERHRRDQRPESYRPIGPIELGERISTKGNWAERKRYVLAGQVRTMCELNRKDQGEVSLALMSPKTVQDLVVEPAEREWKREWIEAMKQLKLFGPDKKPVEKIPYKFSYRFTCGEPGCSGHKMMTEDWEVGQLYRNMRDKFEDEETACNKVKQKFFGEMCATLPGRFLPHSRHTTRKKVRGKARAQQRVKTCSTPIEVHSPAPATDGGLLTAAALLDASFTPHMSE